MRERKKSTIELNFGENEMHEFQRKATVFDTRGKILMSSVFWIVARSFIMGILLLFSGSAWKLEHQKFQDNNKNNSTKTKLIILKT